VGGEVSVFLPASVTRRSPPGHCTRFIGKSLSQPPINILTAWSSLFWIQDIVSYGIARTLGIVDVVEASTSDQPANIASGVGVPLIHIHGESPVSGSRDASSYDLATEHIRARQRDAASNLTVSQPEAFYASESDGLKLAGADIFSPAVSVPPSPTLSRMPTLFEGDTDEHYNEMIEGLRRRLAQGVKQGH
jgi:hypothetical protein